MLILGYDTIKNSTANTTTIQDETTDHYERLYSNDDRLEMFLLGLVSLALTIVNIICIILTGWAILRLKEVTPQKIPQQFSSFWTKDVKVHRDYLSTVRDKNANKTLLEEARQVLGIGETNDHGLENTFIHTLYDKVEQDGDFLNITNMWRAPEPAKTHRTNNLKRQSTVIKEEPIETTMETTYLRHKRTQSVKQGVLNKRLHNQAKMLVRQSLQPLNFDEKHDEIRPRNVTFSDSADSRKKKMRRSPSIPPNTNNMIPARRNGSASRPPKGSTSSNLAIVEEENLIRRS